jgi:hypothetical protein
MSPLASIRQSNVSKPGRVAVRIDAEGVLGAQVEVLILGAEDYVHERLIIVERLPFLIACCTSATRSPALLNLKERREPATNSPENATTLRRDRRHLTLGDI